ncbi:uncharacterized protein LOC130668904 [Microplitis mediator]|uniref:uncharacterized protein LOC130668904 n=1 Tax=Microplitis mediator TaxID=375433 RepID=UPI0025574F27|nr:uncharacterized protein LOC130668904 [Microplitis mediator]
MDTCRMPLEIWLNIWIYLNLVLVGIKSARPRFDTSTDMGNVLIPADAEVDSVIYRLRATDQDVDFPLVFEITATVTPVVRIENLPCTLYNKVCQANVILTRRLTAGRLHDFAVRVRDSKGDSNSMQATISVTNATTPRDKIFPHIPALIMVPEDAKPGKELDYILVRSNPWSGKPVYIELWQPKELFTIRQRQDPSNTKGVITLIGELDFETQSMYTLTIYATDPYTERQRDTRNIAGLHLVVIVQDVQDVAPIFTLAPPLTKINNTVQPGDVILRVHAEDGDKGVPREITYGLVSEGNPFTPFFNITESTGEIILTRPLEELTQITHVGAPIVLSVVAEEIRRSTDEPAAQAAVVEVGLLLGEPGNSPPYFENDIYVAWMDENAEPGSSIIFNEPYSTRVRDEDIGKAGVFALKLENNNGTFEISPAVAERTANFILTVRDNTLIDYEIYKTLRFQITAQEVGPATNLSATVPVTIFLRDKNDNPPEFQEKSYEVVLSENVTAGTRVVQVHATDKDTGSFGRIQYTQIIGSGSEAFVINPDTGVITVAMGTSVLDREITPQLMLSIEACDEDGKGLRSTVPFVVNLIDANDNAPIFEKDIYEFVLNSDLNNFTMPAIIKAFDADADPPNNVIHYEIIHGNYENKFNLDETTGALFLREQITKVRSSRHNSYQRVATKYRKNVIQTHNDSLKISSLKSSSTSMSSILDKNATNADEKVERKKREDKHILFTLTARAYDLGVPHLSSTTQINILQSPLVGVRTIMLLVPGENPDREKTIKTLETITGGRITIQDIRPYTLENLPKGFENGLPSPDGGKKSIVVAQVQQISPGASFVDIEKILSALTANGFGIIGGDMTPGNGNQETKDHNGTIKNTSITTINNEEVIVYKAENKLLFWLLIILGLLILAAVVALIICCICPGCPLYMAPRKRRIHSSETLIARSDSRPKRHLHRRHPQLENIWMEKKQAWSADPTRTQWQFNRRNTNNFGIASLPGDVIRVDHETCNVNRDRDHNYEQPLKASSLQLHDQLMAPVYLVKSSTQKGDERMYVEDIEARVKGHHEIDDGDSELGRKVYRRVKQRELDPQLLRDSHFYRNGSTEVMRLVTRGVDDHTSQIMTHRPPEIVIDQTSIHRVDGKDILLQRFIEDQNLRGEQDYHDSMQDLERQSMESHKRQKKASIQQHKQEILLIPERLDDDNRQHIEELGPDVQRLIIDHGTYEKSSRSDIKGSQDVLSSILIHGSTSKISNIKEQSKHEHQSNLQNYSIHDLELARQNVLLTRLLLEKDRGVGGIGLVDSGSYLETQSLPGQVAAGTQTNQTTATQTDQLNRSRSDNDESEDDGRMRRKRSKKRYDEPKRIRTLWMRSPIREEDRHQYPEKHASLLRKKIKDIKDGRKSSIEQEVLREISDSLDEIGDRDTPLNKREHFIDSSNSRDDEIIHRDDSSSIKILKDKYTKVVSDCEDDRERKDEDKSKKKRDNLSTSKKEIKRDKKTEPSFKILEREMSSLSKKLSKLAGKKLTKCKEDSNHENDKFLTTDSQDKDKDTTPTEFQNEGKERGREKMKKVEIIKSRSRSTQRVTKSTQLKIPKEIEKIIQHKTKYRKKPIISTASSEIEEAADKCLKKQTASKKPDDSKSKFSVGKTIKTKLKRQTAVDDDRKPNATRDSITEKQKNILVKQFKKVDSKSKKSESESSHSKEVIELDKMSFKKSTEESDSKDSDEDSSKLIGSSSMKQSSSSADTSKESRKEEKSMESKIKSSDDIKEISNITLPHTKIDLQAEEVAKSTADSELIKPDKSFRKKSIESSNKSNVGTSPEPVKIRGEKENYDGYKNDKQDYGKKEIEMIRSIVLEQIDLEKKVVETNKNIQLISTVKTMEKLIDKSQKTEKVKENILVELLPVESAVKSPVPEDDAMIEIEEKTKSRESLSSIAEKIIEQSKENMEQFETTASTVVENIVNNTNETDEKEANKVRVIDKLKNFVDSNKVSSEDDEQIKEVFIDHLDNATSIKDSTGDFESTQFIDEMQTNKIDNQNKIDNLHLKIEDLQLNEIKNKQIDEDQFNKMNQQERIDELQLNEIDQQKQINVSQLTEINQQKQIDEMQLDKIDQNHQINENQLIEINQQKQIDVLQLNRIDQQKQIDEMQSNEIDHQNQIDEMQSNEINHQKQIDEMELDNIDQNQQIDENQLIEINQQKQIDVLQLNKIDHQYQVDEMQLNKTDQHKQDDKLQINKNDDEKQESEFEYKKEGEIIKESNIEESNEILPSKSQKILMITPIIESEIKSSMISDLIKDSEILSPKFPEKLKPIIAQEVIVNPEDAAHIKIIEEQTTEDITQEINKSQLQIEEPLSPTSESSRRSSQIIISRETSFLNSPKKLPKDQNNDNNDTPKDSSTSMVTEPQVEIPISNKQVEFPSRDNVLVASEQPQSIVPDVEQLESSLPFEGKHEHSDSTLDALDDDSDVSSESSTKTAFIARPYGTPRHRRLIRMENVHPDNVLQSPINKIEFIEYDNSETLQISLEETKSIVSETVSINPLNVITYSVTEDDQIEEKKEPMEKLEKSIKENAEIEKKIENIKNDSKSVKDVDGNEDNVSKGLNRDINIDQEEMMKKIKDSKDISSDVGSSTTKLLIEIPAIKSNDLETQQEPKKVEKILKIVNEKLDVDSPSLTDHPESIKDPEEDNKLSKNDTNITDGFKKLNIQDTKTETADNLVKHKKVFKSSENIKEQLSKSKNKSKTTMKIIPLSKTSKVKLKTHKEKNRQLEDKNEQPKLSVDKTIKTHDSQVSGQSKTVKSPLESKVKSFSDKIKQRKRLEHDKTIQSETLNDMSDKKLSTDSKKLLQEKDTNKKQDKMGKLELSKESSSSSEVKQNKDKNIFSRKEISLDSEIKVDKVIITSDILKDMTKEIKPLVEVSTQLNKDITTKVDKDVEPKVDTETVVEVDKYVDILVEKETVRAATNTEPLQSITDKIYTSETDQIKKYKLIDTNMKEKKITGMLIEPITSETCNESTSQDDMKEECIQSTSKLSLHVNKHKSDRDKFLSPSKMSKHFREEHAEAQSRYMEWYRQNREETERRKQERKEGDEEEQPPKWLRKSTRQRWLKMSPEDRSIIELRTPEVTPLTRRRVKPLVNIESEQLKAIVRQGRKQRKAEGDKNIDPPIEIFAPEKPTIFQQQPQLKYHHLIQHSEYQYQRMPPPFYLHPPPVPHPTPQPSPERFETPQEQFALTTDSHLHHEPSTLGTTTSLQTGTRLRHQQLLEKKSVFDIAYDEAAPSQLRADSTTPPS